MATADPPKSLPLNTEVGKGRGGQSVRIPDAF